MEDKSKTYTKMDFSVAGDMTLSLNFKVSDKSINIFVSEVDGFVIEMEGGVRFSIPLDESKLAS